MFLSLLAVIPFVFGASVVAQSNPTVVCVAGQCIQGYSNISAGAVLSASDVSTNVRLLPGQYSSSTSPQLLNTLLTSSSASLSLSPGFANFNSSSFSLPLNLALEPGLVVYPGVNYSGPSTFTALPSNNASRDSTSTAAGSLILSSNVWAAVSSESSSSDRLILWNSIPDLSQLPSGSSLSSVSILDIESAACSPPCSGAGICSALGTCTCPPGFTGSSCESCASGFFGATCQACPAGCQTCDDGISGSGRCLVPASSNSTACNCLNGVCGTNGQCTCNSGWTTASNGTACAQCAEGFFLDSAGNCEICQLGCTQCADGTGDCTSCKQGFTQSANDLTKCIAVQSTNSDGTACPPSSFSNGTTCVQCSPLCQTCTGPTSSDCIICGASQFSLNGNCVSTDGNGVCQGSNLIANNNKAECDSCPAKCTKCEIPNFNVASTVDQIQCTGCLPGFVLSQGQCVESCPLGTFLSPQDNLTCTACDSSCSSCVGSSTFCLTCANNQLASDGKCVSSCPADTFTSSGSCITCHPDCASCSGASFSQCSSCPSERPVLTNGRCLPTCSQSQFFDKTSSSCQSCDSSCSSCSGAGPSNCLACSSSSQILRGGTCENVACSGSSSVVSGLGICLSDLVEVPQASGTNSLPPLPSITGINSPVPVTSAAPNVSSGTRLSWWEILLMALGCAFIFVVILMLWRRHARKKRAKATAVFATVKNLNRRGGWKERLVRFGERLFGHKRSHPVYPPHNEQIGMEKLRAVEEARYDRDMDKLLESYEYSRAGSSRGPTPLPSYHEPERDQQRARLAPQHTGNATLTERSLYSQVTGLPRRGPEPRQPLRNARDLLPSRFSGTSYTTSAHSEPQELPSPPSRNFMDAERPPTPAQEYARMVAEGQTEPRGTYWLQPTHTGGSRNPFRQ